MNKDKKKELLKSFSEIEGRVRELEGELEVLWSNATRMSPNINGFPKGSGGANKIESSIERMEKLVVLIDKERDELESVRYKIMAAVRELPNITERRIIHLKYIGKANGKYHRTMTLWKIANELGYSLDWIKHLHSEAMSHLKL